MNTTAMNTTTTDTEAFAFPSNETMTDAPSLPPIAWDGSEADLGIQTQQPSSTNSFLTILFLLGMLSIAILWAIVVARNYSSPRTTGDDEDNATEGNNASLEELEKQILQQFTKQGNHIVLKAQNMRTEDITETESTESDGKGMMEIDLEAGENDGHIVIQRSTKDGKSEELTAPNLCTICLESYAAGDTVTWSTNDQCPHVYHQVCVASFFAHCKKKGKKKCLCPTCRQEYIAFSHEGESENSTNEQEGQQQQQSREAPLYQTYYMRQQRVSFSRSS